MWFSHRKINKKKESKMSLTITLREKCEDRLPMVKDLNYRTLITGVPSGNGCVYVKIKKKKKPAYTKDDNSCALEMNWRSGYCIVMNMKYGTLRQIPGDTKVIPLIGTLDVCPLPLKRLEEVLKSGYQGC